MQTLDAYIRQERMFKRNPTLPWRRRRMAYLRAWDRQEQAVEEFGRFRVEKVWENT